MNLLIILSYPTETESDYQQVRQWFLNHSDFANGTVLKVQCTLPGILPGTKLEKTIDHSSFRQNQMSRYRNAIDTVKVIQQCGFNVQTFF